MTLNDPIGLSNGLRPSQRGPVVATAIALLILLLFSGGCGADSDSDGQEETIFCNTNNDCPELQVCQNGQCRRSSTGCTTDRDCTNGRLCITNICQDRGADLGTIDSGLGAADAPAECLRQDDCDSDESCVNNVCVTDEGDDDVDRDSGVPDQSEEDTGPDCTPGIDCPGDDDPGIGPDTAPDTNTNECEGREDGRLGEVCDGASDCCNGMCLGNPTVGVGICTQDCNNYDDCNPIGVPGDRFCVTTGGLNLCTVSDYGDSCEVASNCTGEVCLKGLGTTGCSWQCRTSADCPASSSCGPICLDSECTTTLDVCSPVGNNCVVDPGSGLNNCLSGTCLTEDDNLFGYCTVFCQTFDSSACPFGFACMEVQEGFPAVCLRF